MNLDSAEVEDRDWLVDVGEEILGGLGEHVQEVRLLFALIED